MSCNQWDVCNKRHAILLALIWAFQLTACGQADAPSRGESVTGTFMEPVADGEGNINGFVVLDEECGHTDDPLYMNRFVTSMFRDAVAVADRLYLVDGSFLWTIDITHLDAPTRLSMIRLPGEPVAIASDNIHTLWVAAGSGGILQLDTRDSDTPTLIAQHSVEGNVLDIAFNNQLVYAVAGNNGLTILDGAQTDPAQTAVLSHLSLSGFLNGVTVQNDNVYISACGSFQVVDATIPHAPVLQQQYLVETGHAKDVNIQNNLLFVSAGEALFAFDVSIPYEARALGFYADPEAEGFYINGAASLDDNVFIAAGDESVRVINISTLSTAAGAAAPIQTPGNELIIDGPFEFHTSQISRAMNVTQIVYGDPINVIRHDNTLFVLGNFRWVGERLVRIMRIDEDGALTEIGALGQPEESSFMATGNDMVVRQRNNQMLDVFQTENGANPVLKASVSFPGAIVRGVFSDGFAILLKDNGRVYTVSKDGTVNTLPKMLHATDLDVLSTGEIIYASPTGDCIFLYSEADSAWQVTCEENQFWGNSRLAAYGRLVVAYNSITGQLLRYDHDNGPLAQRRYVGLCENYAIDDFYSGANESKAKVRVTYQHIFLLCPSNEDQKASVQLFENTSAMQKVADVTLPDGLYRDMAILSNQLYVLSTDNNRYTFSILHVPGAYAKTVATGDGFATQLAPQAYTLLVGDNDQGIRRFQFSNGPTDGMLFEIPFLTTEEVAP